MQTCFTHFIQLIHFTHLFDYLTYNNLQYYNSLSRLHGKDNIAIKRYVISFWNGIDLRYKLLKGPAVKISIAGIIISRVCISYHSCSFLT